MRPARQPREGCSKEPLYALARQYQLKARSPLHAPNASFHREVVNEHQPTAANDHGRAW